MEQYLKSKSILITGGSRGLGKAITKYLAANGARIALHYNKNNEAARQIKEEFPDQILLFNADLSIPEEVRMCINEVLKEFKEIDTVINNAGIAINSDLLGDEDKWIADWQKTIEVNLSAVGFICKKTIQHFIERKMTGRIINIASRAAFRGDTAEYLAYAASKGGLVALTRSLARAYGKNNIMAFTVAPGFIRTDMAESFIEEYGEEYVVNDIALNKLTEPKDVAPMVGFLASGLADHATGGTFDINAGSYVH